MLELVCFRYSLSSTSFPPVVRRLHLLTVSITKLSVSISSAPREHGLIRCSDGQGKQRFVLTAGASQPVHYHVRYASRLGEISGYEQFDSFEN